MAWDWSDSEVYGGPTMHVMRLQLTIELISFGDNPTKKSGLVELLPPVCEARKDAQDHELDIGIAYENSFH